MFPQVSPVTDIRVITNTCMSHRGHENPTAPVSKEKITWHGESVARAGAYKFYPMVMEASGHCNESIDEFMQVVIRELPKHQHKAFRRDFCFATSVGLQRGNARILKHAYARLVASATFGTKSWM